MWQSMYLKLKISLYVFFIVTLICSKASSAENLKSIGKFKDWETFTMTEDGNKVCFTQSIPVLRAPKKLERDASRLFISFRSSENIKNEVSVTSGYVFKEESTVRAKSGNKIFDLFSKENFAWILDEQVEQNLSKQ